MKSYDKYFTNKLAQKFRDKYLVSSKFTFLYYFQNKNDKLTKNNYKDLWSKICSSIDWIDVALSGLNNVDEVTKELKNNTGMKASLKLLHFISTINMLRESVDSMWVAYLSGAGINMYKHPHYPFNKSHDIFNGQILKDPLTKTDIDNNDIYKTVSDDRYFSHIRAFYGVHSTNGSPVKYYYSKNHSYYLRFFSSWSNNFCQDGHYTVMMYCNDPKISDYLSHNSKNYELSINFDELINFALFKYRSLMALACFIDYYKRDVYKKFRQRHLKLDKNQPILNQIIYLRKYSDESKIMSGYYNPEIKRYINYLKLWNTVGSNRYLKSVDVKAINTYLNVLNTHVIRDYFNILNQGKFIRSKYIEAIMITPDYQNNGKYSWEYKQLMNAGDSNLIHGYYDVRLYNQCLNILVKTNTFPEYYKKFKPKELYLLLLSKAYCNDPKIIDKNYNDSWIIY